MVDAGKGGDIDQAERVGIGASRHRSRIIANPKVRRHQRLRANEDVRGEAIGLGRLLRHRIRQKYRGVLVAHQIDQVRVLRQRRCRNLLECAAILHGFRRRR